jgi:hypothetical protein
MVLSGRCAFYRNYRVSWLRQGDTRRALWGAAATFFQPERLLSLIRDNNLSAPLPPCRGGLAHLRGANGRGTVSFNRFLKTCSDRKYLKNFFHFHFTFTNKNFNFATISLKSQICISISFQFQRKLKSFSVSFQFHFTWI